MKSLLAPLPMNMLMDQDDARECLACVADKMATRAAKRALAAEAAAAVQSP